MKAESYRQKRQGVELTGKITLPSGAEFVMRRPPLDLWMAAGRIPQTFLRAMLEAQQGGSNANVQFSTEETMDGLAFLTEAVIYSCVEPRVALTSDDPDVLRLDELDPEDFRFLTGWVQAGSPGVPVKTQNGEVQPEKLARFRQKRPGGGSAGIGNDSAEVLDPSEQAAAIG